MNLINNKLIRRGLSLVYIFAISCTSPTEQDTHDEHDHDDHAHHSENEVHLTGEQMALMGVQMAPPEMMNIAGSIQSSGRLTVPPGKRAIVGSISDGRISEIHIMQGDRIRKGQVLARIEHPEIIEMQEQYLVSKSRLAFLESQYERNKVLFEEEAISAFEFQDIESQVVAEKAINNAFKSKFRLLNISVDQVEKGQFYSSIPIVSPINGFVHEIMVQLGTYVNAEMPLFNIVDISMIHVDLAIFEKDIHKVRTGNPVLFTLVDQQDKVYKGKIFAVGRSFEEETRTLTVHAEIINKDGNLIPGMYINARVVTDSTSGLSIPDDGIVSEGGRLFVFKHVSTKDALRTFEKIEVLTGASDLGFTLIKGKETDILPTDSVVIAGAYYLSAEMGKGELEHHH